MFLRKTDLFSIEAITTAISKNLPENFDCTVHRMPFASKGLFRRIAVCFFCLFHQAQVNHITGDIHFVALFARGSRSLLTIHDFVSLHTLSGIKRFLVWLFWYQLPAWWVQRVVVISTFTRDEFRRFCPLIDERKLIIIHDPLTRQCDFEPRSFNSQRPNLLIVGTKENKNLGRMASALQGLSCTVTVIGELSREQRSQLETSGIPYRNYVRLSDSALRQAYIDCDALLFCSTYEGFGLPIIEAQSIGRVVIASNTCSMPEVAGQGACLVDPFDVSQIRRAVQKICGDEHYRETLIVAGRKNAERFDPKMIAMQYANVYERLALGGM